MTFSVDNTILGFDLDGVLLDHTANKLSVAAGYGIQLAPEQTPSGIFQSHIPQPLKEDVELALYHNISLGRTAPIMPGAFEFLEHVHRAGIPYVLISRRQNIPVTIAMLRYHGLWPRYFNEENTHFVAEKLAKNVKASQLGVTHYIDDEVKVLNMLSAVPYKFLFDMHNILPDGPDYVRARSWSELREIFFANQW